MGKENPIERIASAAVMYKGEIFSGITQGEGFAALLRKYPVLEDVPLQDFYEGYMTSTGKFVCVKEAQEIARSEKQLKSTSREFNSHNVEY